MQLTDSQKEILDYCVDDFTGLWLFVKVISRNLDIDEFDDLPEWIQPKVLDTIRSMLQLKLIEAGTIQKKKFVPFTNTVDEIITYIENEWNLLPRRPTLGDVCWFVSTPLGEQLAKDLNS